MTKDELHSLKRGDTVHHFQFGEVERSPSWLDDDNSVCFVVVLDGEEQRTWFHADEVSFIK